LKTKGWSLSYQSANLSLLSCVVVACVLLAASNAFAQGLLAGLATAPPTDLTVTSKRTKDLVITITSADGRLKGGENSFCVLFQKRETQEPVDVQNIGIDFTLLVGRIQEKPIIGQLIEKQMGRYCGQVNLGKLYSVPASYYAFVRYTDEAGKKRKQRLFLSVR
jgi:hypothetical protein